MQSSSNPDIPNKDDLGEVHQIRLVDKDGSTTSHIRALNGEMLRMADWITVAVPRKSLPASLYAPGAYTVNWEDAAENNKRLAEALGLGADDE